MFLHSVFGWDRKNDKELDSLINLSEAYKAINKMDCAYFMLLKYTTVKDSLRAIDNNKDSTYKIKYEREKKERKLAELKTQIHIHHNRIVYWSGGSLLVLLLAGGLGFMVVRQRSKRKQIEVELKNKKAAFQLKERENELELQMSRIELEIAQERTNSIDKAYKDINRILHDELSADIGLISSKLEVMVMENTKAQWNIINDLQNIRNRVRNVAHEIGYFPDKNLHDCLNEFFEIKNKKYKTIHFEFLELPYKNVTELIYGRQANSLFIIIREAVNNAIQHAEATQIHTSVALEEDKIKIQIIDNGKGFNTKKVKKTGLENIKERAFVLHGKLSIHSNEKGTTITVIVPIDESDEFNNGT